MADHAGHVTAPLARDDLTVSTGVDYRGLTMPSFMDNLLNQVQAIKSEDIAAVAAALLRDSSWCGVAHLPILGPKDLSNKDMARIMSDVLGKPTVFQRISKDACKAQFIGFGLSDAPLDVADIGYRLRQTAWAAGMPPRARGPCCTGGSRSWVYGRCGLRRRW